MSAGLDHHSPRDAGDVARILKVNHAGEFGAIRIYRAQLLVARLCYPEIVDELAGILRHEERHLAGFREAMPPRGTRPCRAMALWGLGGYSLGLMTALLGRRRVWTCTAVVEATVHRHLGDQMAFLAGRDDTLRDLIAEISNEELSHLGRARFQAPAPDGLDRLLRVVIGGTTEALIWLSTWGASARMARALRPRR